MLLLLDHSYQGIRGGEAYFSHLHKFLKSNFNNIYPAEITQQPPELEKITRHAVFSLDLTKKHCPAMVETDISSGLRNIMAVRWAKNHGSKVLVVFMERRMVFRLRNFFAVKWLVRRCENYLLRKADIVLVISQYCARLVKEIAGDKATIIIAHPGLQVPHFSVNEIEAFPRNNRETIELLFVGASDWASKGVQYLIKAMPTLADIKVRLNIVGGYDKDSPEHRKQERLIKRLGLNSVVKFHGYVDRQTLISFYQRSSIFVLPSLVEGYGMALAEAISFGLPVVSTNVTAIPEMLEDGVNALLVPPKDPKSLSEAIRKLALDRPARDGMSRRNLDRAKSLPQWDDFEIVLKQKLIPAIEQMTPLRAIIYPIKT